MDMDPDIATWMLDFLLRLPLEERILNPLLRAVPVLGNIPVLGKLLLLNKIESQVSSHSVSERTLKLLERLKEIELQEGSGRVSDSMRRAYCAVAVECTVRILVNGNHRDSGVRFKYYEAVVRLWRRRLRSMEKCGLWSEDLWRWKDEIEAAVLDDGVCESIVKKIEGFNASEAVQAYLREERDNMGPSFLELVANAATEDEVLHKILSVDGVAGEDAATNSSSITVNLKNVNKAGSIQSITRGEAETCINGTENRKVHPQNHPIGSVSGHSKRVQFLDSGEMKSGPSLRDIDLPSTAGFKRVRGSIKSSSADLQAVVTDPLSDAVKIAEHISGVLDQSKCHYPAEENHVEDMSGVAGGNKYHDPGEIHVESISAEGDVQGIDNYVTDLPCTSLMQQNASAHTNQRHERHSTNASQVDPDSDWERPKLPTPKSIKVSPLKKSEHEAPKRRRIPRRWSSLEEDTLRTAIKKFGMGNWKYILNAHNNIFLGRTEVDLKDKWRNMMRY